MARRGKIGSVLRRMDPLQLTLFAVCLFIVSLLYSCVGHAGASGYIATMALFGFSPASIKPTALVLNILVACLVTWQFRRAGHFSWPLFWPFAAASIPCAFLGGYLTLPTHLFKILIALVLLFSAARFFFTKSSVEAPVHPPPRAVAVGSGAALGLLSGLTGVGGGIFLTPLLLLCKWALTKQAAAVSAAFILVNSISGLAGHLGKGGGLPAMLPIPIIAAVGGGFLGSRLGSTRLPVLALKRLLAAVLLVAGLKLLLT